MNLPYLGYLNTLFPDLYWIYFLIGAVIAIFGAITIQVFVETNNKKALTFLGYSLLGSIYFYLVCPDLVLFFLSNAFFYSVQGLYFSMRKFKESL